MSKRKIIPYNPKLKQLARDLRNNSTKAEIKLWQEVKGKQILNYDFHRQKPLLDYIVDFYCYELNLVIELDGYSHQFEEVYDKDLTKTKKLEELGLTILRFDDDKVMKDMPNVLRTIEQYIINFEKHTPNPSQEGKEVL
ncbi:MAG: DUF559 domain-containing protein [Vicingus serpentipes]|nr:DUF559 domain-containing protein [Vicingus serpentipes]